MSNEDTNGPAKAPEIPGPDPVQTRKRSRGAFIIGGSALAGMLLVGAIAGATAMRFAGHDQRQALLPPVAINAMADDSLVAVKGKVAEMFGNKFIITDASGRALVDAGPAGDKALVAQNEEVTVQGRFDDGFVRAGMVIHADGRVDELRPPHRHGPRHGWRDSGPGERDHGPRGDDGPARPAPPQP